MRTLITVATLLAVAFRAQAQDRAGASEHEIKAAFLLNFARYTEWPQKAFESDDAPFTLAVVGRDPFGADLDSMLKDKRVAGRPIRVVRFEKAADVRPCHLVFVAGSERDSLSAVVDAVKDRPSLVVGETDGFVGRGGAVNFYLEGDKVRFEVGPDVVERHGLKMSSKLLRLARIVKGK
jgi:hypothetical protein